MKQKPLWTTAVLISFLMPGCSTQKTDNFDAAAEERAIRQVLSAQEAAWNAGSIEEFMEGYWHSDSLRFIGTGITTSWQATLERYRRTYPDRATMGELKFEFYRFYFINQHSCLVTGRYSLKRATDEPTGMFTLLIEKINDEWLIVYDHTS